MEIAERLGCLTGDWGAAQGWDYSDHHHMYQKQAVADQHTHHRKRAEVFGVAGKFGPIGRQMIDDAFQRGVERLGCDQDQRQDAKGKQLGGTGLQQQQGRKHHKARQQFKTKCGFLQQPAHSADGIAGSGEKMRDAGDAGRFGAGFWHRDGGGPVSLQGDLCAVRGRCPPAGDHCARRAAMPDLEPGEIAGRCMATGGRLSLCG